MDGEKLREGIFALRTRRVGSVAECMIMRLLNYSKGRSLFHDLYDDNLNHRIEVKFSVVLKKAETTVTINTVLRCIEEAVAENRMVAFSDWKRHKFDCNIQQVKRNEFDVLYYGLFFSDCIKIFRIECQEIKENSKGGRIYYSDLQHKGNIGEGQFHIKTENLQTHPDHYHYKTLSYVELYELLAADSQNLKDLPVIDVISCSEVDKNNL